MNKKYRFTLDLQLDFKDKIIGEAREHHIKRLQAIMEYLFVHPEKLAELVNTRFISIFFENLDSLKGKQLDYNFDRKLKELAMELPEDAAYYLKTLYDIGYKEEISPKIYEENMALLLDQFWNFEVVDQQINEIPLN